MRSDNYYLRRIKSSLSYGRTTYDTVKALFVENLSSMGVDCSTDDGMTTLANKILEIEPSVGELDLDISSELVSQSATVILGDDVVLNCTLNADYDSPDVDLKGKLQNASVNFYLGDTLLGTLVTNSSGVATYNYTTSDLGSLTFKSDFDGTENYDSCESNTVSVTVSKATPSLSISASSSSVNVGGTSTISGVLADGDVKIENATIKLYDSEDTLIDTLTTNQDGEYSKTISFNTTGTYSYYAVFEGDSDYNSVTSSSVSVNVTDLLCCEIVIDGSTISSAPSIVKILGNGGSVDYGDGTVETFTQSYTLNHTYATSGVHSIKIYRKSANYKLSWDGSSDLGLGQNNIISVDLRFTWGFTPTAIAFKECTNLAYVKLYWESSAFFDIPTYSTNHIPNNEGMTISIPYGTMTDYVNAGYPSDKLVERSE